MRQIQCRIRVTTLLSKIVLWIIFRGDRAQKPNYSNDSMTHFWVMYRNEGDWVDWFLQPPFLLRGLRTGGWDPLCNKLRRLKWVGIQYYFLQRMEQHFLQCQIALYSPSFLLVLMENIIIFLHLCSVPRDQRQAGRSLKKKAAKMLNVTMINRPCGIAYACSKLFMLCSAASENS